MDNCLTPVFDFRDLDQNRPEIDLKLGICCQISNFKRSALVKGIIKCPVRN